MTPEQFELHARIEDIHWWFVGRKHIVSTLVQATVFDEGEKILIDLGCGTGGNVGVFQDKFNCIGVDISEYAIHFAKKRFPNVNFICGTFGKTLCPIFEKADIVLLLDVLEHIENDSQFLRNLIINMKQGAYLLMTVPSDMSLWSPQDEFLGHFRRYSFKELLAMFTELPVSIKLLSYYNSLLYPIVKAVRMVTNLRGRTWGKAGTDLSIPPWPINTFLTKIFASESKCLLKRIDHPSMPLFPFGVSLISILKKD